MNTHTWWLCVVLLVAVVVVTPAWASSKAPALTIETKPAPRAQAAMPPAHAVVHAPAPLAVQASADTAHAVHVAGSEGPQPLPARCTTGTGDGKKTRPCLMIWHAGRHDAVPRVPSSSAWAVVKSHAVGHAAMWLCSTDAADSDSTNKDCYASWWPQNGSSGFGKADAMGPADPHSYAEDLKGEGHAPDFVIELDGWDPACLVKHFKEVVLATPTYNFLTRNCVCVVADLLKRCPRNADWLGEKAMTMLEHLDAWTPDVLHAWATMYEEYSTHCICDGEYCAKKAGSKRRSSDTPYYKLDADTARSPRSPRTPRSRLFGDSERLPFII